MMVSDHYKIFAININKQQIIIFISFFVVRGFEQITRQCGVVGSILKPCDSMRSAESCHMCQSSLCNGSTNLLTNLWLSILPFVIAIIIKF